MKDPQGYGRARWLPVEILDLRRFKEVMVSYGKTLTIFEAVVKFRIN